MFNLNRFKHVFIFSTTTSTPDTSTTSTLGESFPVRIAGSPFGSGPIKRPSPYTPADKGSQVGTGHDDSLEEEGDDEVKRKEVINNNINGAIVESIPGNKLTAEELDPETKYFFFNPKIIKWFFNLNRGVLSTGVLAL